MPRLTATAASISCLLRGVPLLFRATPRTPLRVLCIVALDTIHVLRHSRPLSRARRMDIAACLDFQALTNAMWDGKPLSAARYDVLRQRLVDAGLARWVTEYLCRLHALETARPPVGIKERRSGVPAGSDRRRFDEVRVYREDVARLSLATVIAIALDADTLDDAIRATHDDRDVAALFRMAMQCQIIDDVLDYDGDLRAGLPSFLTASASPADAIAWTHDAVGFYAEGGGLLAGGVAFPLEAALHVLTLVARVVVRVARRAS